MKIAYLLNSVSRKAGGLFEICRRLAQTLAKTDEAYVFGTEDEFTNQDLAAWAPLKPKTFPVVGPGNFGFAREYAGELQSITPDIAHVHALWIYPSRVGYSWHRRTKRPFIYTAHGMLDRWAVRNSGWKKRLVRALWEDAAHRAAACFQVNSEAEYRSVRDYGLRNPICIIPNGIDLPDKIARSLAPWTDRARGRRVLFYLGRLHPKKNLVSLLNAWAAVRHDAKAHEWLLVIAGWDEGGYKNLLRRRAKELGIECNVHFSEPLFGDEKAAAYQNADAFVLPSLSEGLPMVVLEAWSFAKPVLMTPECNLPEGFAADAALRISITSDTIKLGLRTLFEMNDAERQEMGASGRALVSQRFAWPRIGEQMCAVYQWVLGGGAPPETVRLN